MMRTTLIGAIAVLTSIIHHPTARAENPEPVNPIEKQVFDGLLEAYTDLTWDELARGLNDPDYRTKLGFDPTKAKYYDEMAERLHLNAREIELFKANGFVSIDHGQRYSFGSAYYGIYTRDLPVLVTTDSILHAMHKSYDDILMSMETHVFTPAINRVLTDAHEKLAATSDSEANRDVDLYLTVARNLLAGAGADEPAPADQTDRRWTDGWDGTTLDVKTAFGQDDDALRLLNRVKSLELEHPTTGKGPTAVYGGKRFVDWSQFRPRGHYAKSAPLKRYFRAMMWLGRADTGFHVLEPDSRSQIAVDADRELRAAINITMLLRQTGGDKALEGIDDVLGFMVGQSDNLSIFGVQKMLDDMKLNSLAEATDAEAFTKIKDAIRSGDYAEQMIRSQLVMSAPGVASKVRPPALFQVFGQRYIIDSFVLSQVVFDSIRFETINQERMMPWGLDVMAALGNDEALRLLEPEVRTWKYAANLCASRDYVNLHKGEFWDDNLYNLWVGSLRLLDDKPTAGAFPQVMQTKAWQMKQLQTQMASWSQLRHDTILYAKQSYTGGVSCEYPAGYVEPYPEFYAAIAKFGKIAGAKFESIDFVAMLDPEKDKHAIRTVKHFQDACPKFFKGFTETVERLESLARKELASEPFTADDVAFLKKTIDKRGGGSGPPHYDGWFSSLFFQRTSTDAWDPEIVDVHTDPNSGEALEVGTGDVNFLVVAIDNEDDQRVYVGPVFTYYEFHQDAERRLTDDEWQKMIHEGKTPARPAWTDVFQGPTEQRTLPNRK